MNTQVTQINTARDASVEMIARCTLGIDTLETRACHLDFHNLEAHKIKEALMLAYTLGLGAGAGLVQGDPRIAGGEFPIAG